jgi:hypothetical protein
MTYIFLIIVVAGNSPSLQVESMQSLDQCYAAMKAIDIAKEQNTWSEFIPRINNMKCVEVKGE